MRYAYFCFQTLVPAQLLLQPLLRLPQLQLPLREQFAMVTFSPSVCARIESTQYLTVVMTRDGMECAVNSVIIWLEEVGK